MRRRQRAALGSQRRHFGRIFLVGGGALLLGQELTVPHCTKLPENLTLGSTFLRRHANLE
jgi:hypothetical protein